MFDFDYILNGKRQAKRQVKSKSMFDPIPTMNSIFHGTNRPMRVNRMRNVPQRVYLKKTNRMTTSRFFDSDRDGVVNGLDCFPWDVKRHTTPIRDAKFISLYHGTQADKLEKIKNEGLVPQSTGRDEKTKVNFLTPSLSSATYHATTGSEIEQMKRREINQSSNNENYRYGPTSRFFGSSDKRVLKVTLPSKDIPVEQRNHLIKQIEEKGEFYEVEIPNKIDPKNIKEVDYSEAEKRSIRKYGNKEIAYLTRPKMYIQKDKPDMSVVNELDPEQEVHNTIQDTDDEQALGEVK